MSCISVNDDENIGESVASFFRVEERRSAYLLSICK
jgi:hypothetical protein